MKKEKYINGQVWRAEWPKCYTIVIIFVSCKRIGNKWIPYYIVISLDRHATDEYLSCPGMFHTNLKVGKYEYLYAPKDLDKFLGKNAKLLNYRLEFTPKKERYFGSYITE